VAVLGSSDTNSTQRGRLYSAIRLRGKIPHDFRRTAVRNLARIGVDRKTAMEMVGHKAESIYRRYTITDEAMLRDASARLAALHEAEREENSQSTAKVRGVSASEADRSPRVSSSGGTTRLVAWDGVEPPTRGFSEPGQHRAILRHPREPAWIAGGITLQ